MTEVGLCGVVGLPRPEHRLAIHVHRHVLQAERGPKAIWTDLEVEF